jgi:hypothetical protein
MKTMISDSRKLKKVTVLCDGGNRWTLQWDTGFHVFMGTIEEFSKFLQRIKAKDTKKEPSSFRSMKYYDIAVELTNGIDISIWVWEKDLKVIKK